MTDSLIAETRTSSGGGDEIRTFFAGKLDEAMLGELDVDFKRKRWELFETVDRENWTKKQRKVQKRKILQPIAIFFVLMERGISRERA